MSTQVDRVAVDRIASECLARKVRILNRAITNLYDSALRPLGVKVSQMNILVVAAKLGVARPGQICEILHMDASTLSRNAERMVAKGWLEVVAGGDARAQPLRITKQGRRLLEQAFPAWEKAQSQARTILGEPGLSLLVETSLKLDEASARH
jgi:DNA-binding MarR family transcriptional regulator